MDDEENSTENNLDLKNDLIFVDNVLRSLKVQADADAHVLLLKEAYALAIDKLVKARRFADVKNKSLIDVEDLRVADVEKVKMLPTGGESDLEYNAHLKQLLSKMSKNNETKINDCESP
ncbi:GH19028 [Drosophila grimshawi]|uniref:GH19028 n=1 Tax=Drosophila grimshawi TaxID=7222 RepID=B4JI42_DROGR|nr:GH19028 [Drosophila grimshawi]